MSSTLYPFLENILVQVLKLFMQRLLAKLLISISQPTSQAAQPAVAQMKVLIWLVSVVLVARSSRQLTLPPYIQLEQLYLQPWGTWMDWQKELEKPENMESFMRDRQSELFQQGSTSSQYIDTPTELQLAQAVFVTVPVKSAEETTGSNHQAATCTASRTATNNTAFIAFQARIVQLLSTHIQQRLIPSRTHPNPNFKTRTLPCPSPALIIQIRAGVRSIHNNRTSAMANNESSSFCNLTLEEGDLRKLEELDPFQTDGYQTLAKIPLTVAIVYTSETGRETRDVQPVVLQLLTRWLKPQPAKGKEAKGEPHLDSLKIYLSSEEDIFLSLVSNLSASSFEALKTKNELNLHFRDFPNSLAGMLRNCGGSEGQNRAELQLSFEGTGRLVVTQHTEYKEIELAELHFTANSLEKAHQSIIFRYNYNRTKLAMLEHSIEAVYALLAAKNPPLLAYIQKTVGN